MRRIRKKTDRKDFMTACGLLTSLLLLLAGCSSDGAPVSRTGFYYDTVITITLYEADSEPLMEGCFQIADQYEKLFSASKEGSDVWRINHALGEPVTVSEDTLRLLRMAAGWAKVTGGAVDPTVGSLSSLWDFTSGGEGIVPEESLVREASDHVDYRNLTLSGRTAALTDPDSLVDLGFIAKGYIADRMKEYLLNEGVDSAVINLGGNVLTIGDRPDGAPYRIGIQKPFDDRGSAIATLSVSDKSVVSSGVYERYFEQDGLLYHHILDTKTGYPVRNNLLEVTIVSDSSTDGDALSTACFALGLADGTRLIESLEGVEAVFITDDGRIYPTEGLSGLSCPLHNG